MRFNMQYFWGIAMLNVIGTVSAGMFVKPGVIEKAQGLYKEAPLQDETTSRNGAARDFRECLVDHNVFVSPFPDPANDTVKVPQITNTMCEYTDKNGTPAQPVILKYKPRLLRKEIKRFHECICREKRYKHGGHCHFNMLQTGYSISVLQGVLGSDTQSALGILTSGRQEFHCHIKKNFTIACRIKTNNITLNDTKLYRTLVCLSNALTYHVCGQEQLPTNPNNPQETTVRPAGSSAKQRKLTLRFVFLGMGCFLFMLIGILTTVCVVRCWRQRRKKRQKKSIVKRPQEHARSNSYADNLNHVYDYLPGEVPDILQQSSGNPVHSRFGSERSISVNSTLRSASYSPSVREQGYYEPLNRQDGAPSLPNRPVPKPRWQMSVPEGNSNDYLDLIEEAKVEEQEDSTTDPKYFVLEKTGEVRNNQEPEPETPADEYVALLDEEQDPRDQDEDMKTKGTGARIEDREPAAEYDTRNATSKSVKDNDYFVLESSEGEVSGLVVNDDLSGDLSGQVDENTEGPQGDQYETPVPEIPSFDLASSFKCKGSTEGLDKIRYKDYEKIMPKVSEEERCKGGVLEA